MLGLILSRSGYGKTTLIHDKIKELIANGKKTVLLIPEQISFETEKEMLQLLGAAKASSVEVMSFTQFCRMFFAKYGKRDKPYIDATGSAALMEATLKKLEPELTLFRKQAKTPEFCTLMIDFSQKIKRYSVEVDSLMKEAEKNSGTLKQKLFETALILSEYENMLKKDYIDPLDNLTVVGEMLPDHPFFAEKTVFVDSFTGFTLQQMKVIENIIKTAENTYISLGFDGVYGNTDFTTFANMAKTANSLKQIAKDNSIKLSPDIVLTENCRANNEELDFLEKNIFAPDYNIFDKKPENIIIGQAKNIYTEADYVARQIHKLVRTTDIRYRDIAVISRDADSYNGVIDTAFERYDIPCFVDNRKGVEHLALFKFVTFALEAVLGHFECDSIISMLKTGLTEFSDEEISLFEIYLIVWQINREEFEKEFTYPVDDFVLGDESERTAALQTVEKIRKTVIDALSSLKKRAFKNAKQISLAVYSFMNDLKADKALKNLADTICDVRLRDITVRSYDILINVLDQLWLSLGEIELDLKRYYELFCSAISLLDTGSLPQGLDQVAVGSAERMRPKSPKITFIIGAVDGVFPSTSSGMGVFSDDELTILKQDGIVLPFYDVDTAVDEQYLAYNAVCSPSQKLFVTYPSSTLSGEEKQPSIIVESLLDIFPETDIINCDVTEIENEDTALKLLAMSDSELCPSVRKYFEENPNDNYNSMKYISEKGQFKLSPEVASELYGKNIYTSASKIDVFHKCKFYYFCKYGIKANPVRVAKVDNLTRGSLVHCCLEKMIEAYSPEEFSALSDKQIYDDVVKITDDFCKEEFAGKEMSKIDKYKYDRLTEMLCDLVKRVFEELLQTEFKKFKTELSIGGKAPDVPAFEIPFENGRKIILNGFIDRVDVCEKNGEKYVRILDYKTGSKELKLSDVFVGQNLQMLVYMMALQKNGSELLGSFLPAGIFYYPARDPIVTAEHNIDDDDLKTKQLKSVKMSGILLDNKAAYSAIEPGCMGIYSPVSIKKNGKLKKTVSAYSLRQFGILSRYIEKLFVQMGENMLSGDISCEPTDGVNTNACAYCDYYSVCMYEGEISKADKFKDNTEAFEAMEEEVEQ